MLANFNVPRAPSKGRPYPPPNQTRPLQPQFPPTAPQGPAAATGQPPYIVKGCCPDYVHCNTCNGHHAVLKSVKHIGFAIARLGIDERREVVRFMDRLLKRDMITFLPIPVTRKILGHLTAQELAAARLVSKSWNIRCLDNVLWRDHCVAQGMLPAQHEYAGSLPMDKHGAPPVYFDLFRKRMISIYTWKTFHCRRSVQKACKIPGPVLCVIAIDSSCFVAGCADNTVSLWVRDAERPSGFQFKPYYSPPLDSVVVCLAHEQGLLACGTSAGFIVLFDINEKYACTFRAKLLGHEAQVTSLAFGADYTVLYSASKDGTVRVWDTLNRCCLRVFCGHTGTVNCLAFIPQQVITRAASQHEDYYSKKERKMMRDTTRYGWLITASSDRSVCLWDLRTEDHGYVSQSLTNMKSAVTSMGVYAPIAAANEDFSLNTAYTRARRPLPLPPFVSLSTEDDKGITLWSLPSLKPIDVKPPYSHEQHIISMTIVPNYGKIITGSRDRMVKVWHLKSPDLVTTLGGFIGGATCSSVSPMEDVLCIGSQSGHLVFYSFSYLA